MEDRYYCMEVFNRHNVYGLGLGLILSSAFTVLRDLDAHFSKISEGSALLRKGRGAVAPSPWTSPRWSASIAVSCDSLCRANRGVVRIMYIANCRYYIEACG